MNKISFSIKSSCFAKERCSPIIADFKFLDMQHENNFLQHIWWHFHRYNLLFRHIFATLNFHHYTDEKRMSSYIYIWQAIAKLIQNQGHSSRLPKMTIRERSFKKTQRFWYTVTMTSIRGLHRSLFHPLATVRHRIWAGPENIQNRTQQLL
jgi:hypothetical protein